MAATEAGTKAARALDELYREHVGDVYRYAYAVLGNHADAEDVTQTTFVNALRALERGERPRKAGNWLIVIAHNLIRQRWRQEHTRPDHVTLAENVAGPATEETQPPLDDLVRALQRIPPNQREALVMRELEGRPYAEIAELLGVSMSALETLLFRARRSLAEEMENLVTCDRAELAISRQLDKRLGRKERRRLDDHLRECPACAAFAAAQQRQRRAMRSLAVVPLPATLMLWKGAPSASAAAALPAIGLGSGAAAGTGAAVGTGAATGSAVGGLALGGVAVKAAAVVAAVGVVGGVSYEGVKIAGNERAQSRAAAQAVEKASPASALSASRAVPGRAKAAAAKAKAGGAAAAEKAKKTSAAKKAAAKARAAKARAAKARAARARAAKAGAVKANGRNAPKSADAGAGRAAAKPKPATGRGSGRGGGTNSSSAAATSPSEGSKAIRAVQPADSVDGAASGAKGSKPKPAGASKAKQVETNARAAGQG